MPLSYSGIAGGSQAASAQLKQVLDLLTGVMTDQAVTLALAAGSPLSLNRIQTPAALMGHLAAKRSGVTKWFLGLDAADQFLLLNAAGTAGLFGVTDLGSGLVSLDLGSAAGKLTLASQQASAQALSFPAIRQAETIAVQPAYTSPDLSASAPGGVSSLGYLHLGLGASVSLTPQVTGRVRLKWGWNVADNTAGKTTSTQARYGTGTAPAFAASPVGTQAPPGITRVIGFTLGTYTYSGELSGVITGLTLGTAYWFDLTVLVNGGTGTWSQFTVEVTEF